MAEAEFAKKWGHRTAWQGMYQCHLLTAGQGTIASAVTKAVCMSSEVRIWDLPTRLFHWALLPLLVGLVVTGYKGGAAMQWHARLGYAVLWSRFRSFLYSPGAFFAHLRGRTHPDHLVGHNPVGAVSVFTMLAVLLAQVATGLFADDEIAFTGPLNRFVESSKGLAATWYHKQVGQWLLLSLVALHIIAVLYYQLRKKQNLVGPMLRGDKLIAHRVEGSRDTPGTRLKALMLLAACGGAVAWLVRVGG